jgi:acetolactate synthase-1/2/3 large subunit
MLTLDRPTIDWVSMARGMGLDAARATTLGEFGQAFARALAVKGPALVELVV